MGTHDVIVRGGAEVVVHPDAFTHLEATGPGRQGGGGSLPGGGGGGGTIRDGGRGGGGDRTGDLDAPEVGGELPGGDAPGDGDGHGPEGGTPGPDDGGDAPDVEEAPRLGLDDTETAGAPVEADNGLTLDVITGGPLVALRPRSWDRQACTSDPCGAFGVG